MAATAKTADPQDLVNALSLTVDRENGRWLDEKRVEEFRRQVKVRGRKLDILCLQAVRLAVLMEAAEPRGYQLFLHFNLRRLTEAQFKAALETAQGRGLLAGRFEVGKEGVTFLESGLRLGAEGDFKLKWGQLPFAAAYLDFLQNCIGHEVLAGFLKPLFADPNEPGAADRLTSALKIEFDRWLKGRIASEHLIKQGKTMGTFLKAVSTAQARFAAEETAEGWRETVTVVLDGVASQPVRVNAWHRDRWPSSYGKFAATRADTVANESAASDRYVDLIADETILAYWSHQILHLSGAAEQGGVLDFRSAGRAMLRYRSALQLETVEREVTGARSSSRDDGTERDYSESRIDEVEAWTSPLAPLLKPPCDKVKWLTGEMVNDLSDVFDRGMAEDADLLQPGEHLKKGDGKGSLFGRNRPEERFAVTLLRYIQFGGLQEKAKKRMAEGWVPERPNYAAGYEPIVERYRKVGGVVAALPHCTANALLARRDPAAVAVLLDIEPDAVTTALLHGGATREDIEDMSDMRKLKKVAAYLAMPGNEAHARLIRAAGANRRQGFNETDPNGAAYDEALREGSVHLARLMTEFERVNGWISRADLRADFVADLDRFNAVLVHRYGRQQAAEASAD